jgi:hypothetical protein
MLKNIIILLLIGWLVLVVMMVSGCSSGKMQETAIRREDRFHNTANRIFDALP